MSNQIFKEVFIIFTILLILIAIFLFEFIVFIHELGHFSMARLFGIQVNEFAIGMGPAILKKKKKNTLYSLRLFPIGGYCSMEGEDTISQSANAFNKKKVWQRIIVVAAGSIFNLILAFLFVMILLSQQPLFASTTVSKFTENAQSSTSGLAIGDTITEIDGYKIFTIQDLNFVLSINDSGKANVKVNRNGKEINFNEIKFTLTKNEKGKTVIQRDFYVQPIENNPLTLITQSFNQLVSTVRITFASLGGLLSGKFSFNEVSGPVGIATVVGEAATEGLKIDFLTAFNNILNIMALVAVSLGIMNLLPLPALDGGRLIFLLIEAIFRKPVPEKYETLVHTAGFIFLLGLMAIIMFNDIFKIVLNRGT